jgi:hypothetical protein
MQAAKTTLGVAMAAVVLFDVGTSAVQAYSCLKIDEYRKHYQCPAPDQILPTLGIKVATALYTLWQQPASAPSPALQQQRTLIVGQG